MKPMDGRLLRHAHSARNYVFITAGLGIAKAGLVVVQAWLLANLIGLAITEAASIEQASARLISLVVVTVGRAGLAGTQQRLAHRAATKTIAQLREQLLRQVVALGPRWLSGERSSQTATLATRGLNALDAYFSDYLPQLLMVGTLTPALLVVVAVLDWTSALIILLTLPLIPLFMVLIGKVTAAFAGRRLSAMTTLGARVLDLLAGLPTLKALGREAGPAKRVRELSNAHANATFGTVKVAFLSGAALELVSTLSVAVVAVEIGLRLAYGRLGLATGLAVIIMAPEVFLPLRGMGSHYHAAANGLAAAQAAFTILETPAPTAGQLAAPNLQTARVELSGISVRPPGSDRLSPAGLDLTLRPGCLTALTGPNGVGKSTAVAVLLGLVKPDAGMVIITEPAGASFDLTDLDLSTWWSQIAWVPQRPALLPGTVWENLTGQFGQPQPRTQTELANARQACQAAGFTEVLEALPDSWATLLGHGGVGLSVGQRQRLALARALLDPSRQLVILDEPTAHLDQQTEQTILATTKMLADQGRCVLVVAHRPSLIAAADQIVAVQSAEVQS